MEIESLNCRCCGGVLRVKSSLCVCDYCGATNFISDVASKYINQLNRANKLRQEREFDNAARIYDVILEENPPTADILWQRTLCEYGIEYVPDPVSDKYFPTLHRINEESILAYPSYIDALALADKEQKESLQKEAEYINTIQNEYLHIAENEAPYDVFICYKETDEDTGEKTEDVELAEELYRDLTSRGFKVFFAKETLQTKLSIDYEPYIFAALKSSRAMVVLGTKAEYFMSVWVKNEWGRFLKLMQNDDNKQMFFACDDPEELPRAFATKQAQLLGTEDAIRNLANNVERFLRKNRKVEELPDSERERLYEKALNLILIKDHYGAKPIIERLIKNYPGYAPGYWLRMLNTVQATPSNITHMQIDLYPNPDYQKAVELADGELKDIYKKTAELCKNNLLDQTKFDKILEEKSIDYVSNFDKTDLGKKKNEIMDNIGRYAITVDIFNNRLRTTFAVGFILFAIGNIFSMLLYKTAGYSRVGGKINMLWMTLFAAPLILAGIAIALSYSLLIDLVTTGSVCLLLIVSVFLPTKYDVLYFISVLVPIVVYIATSQSYTLNKNRYIMVNASLGIEGELERLKKTLSSVSEDMSSMASKLLKQFKEENNSNSNVELKEDDYLKAQENLNIMYESAKEKYTKYIGVSIPMVRATYQKTESGLSSVAMLMSMIPLLSFFSFIVAIVDLTSDKYKEYKHYLSTISLILNLGAFIVLIFFFTRW